MTVLALLKDKSIKPKEKTESISQWLLDGSLPVEELLAQAETLKAPDKATCIEALEFASRQQPKIADENVLTFVSQTLAEQAPRVKWESAKVIGNIAHLYPTALETAVAQLLLNTSHEGTVVRWSAAFALGEILKLKTPLNVELLPAVEAVCAREEKNSIRKIYLDAIKRSKV